MLKKFQDLLSIVTLTSLVFSTLVTAKGNSRTANQTAQISTAEKAPEKPAPTGYGKMPVLFEQNKGQTDEAAKFIARGSGYTLYLAEQEAVFSLKVPVPETETENFAKVPKTGKKIKSDALKMRFAGANAKPQMSGESQTITKTNYYIDKKR